ncbi:MAG: four helix bundle protein [Parcubacteria group bacterium]
MAELNFHNADEFPPDRRNDVPILHVFKESYKLWHEQLQHLARPTRYTIGVKIDGLFTDLIQLTLNAEYVKREEKFPVLKQMSEKIDALKYFLTILWELKGIPNGAYAQIADKLANCGRMLGGWLKNFK